MTRATRCNLLSRAGRPRATCGRFRPGQAGHHRARAPLASLALLALGLAAAASLLGCSGQQGTTAAQADETDGEAASQPPPEHTNRLANESSPYLLLHAHNPVDWYPWGPEAFEKARRENKPIFLSIGYSSCYWCHVMERQSFSDDEIARFLNEHFVNIKVDREERPDLDEIYMTSCVLYFQLIGSPQGGGWPLSLFLTPEGKPFAAGTYFPPEDTDGRLGFLSVLKRVDDLWSNQRAALKQNADVLTTQVQQALKPETPLETVELNRELVKSVVDSVKASYDAEFGGVDFSELNPNEPKFPVPGKLALLQRELLRHGDDEAGRIVHHTLDRLAAGGIHDHLAGGFHRYSTDRRWHVPHFEKMLYDQAQLADVYVEAYRHTSKRLYREVAEGIFAFVLAEMTLPDAPDEPGGGFYSAIDAETDAVEGQYYVWSEAELQDVLGESDAALFGRVYGLDEDNPFEPGYVLHLPQPLSQAAADEKLSVGELERRLSAMREKLLEARRQRKAPLKDDKILTSWNGLMIRAFARAGQVLGREDYLEQARKSALFVLSRMRDADGHLLHSFRIDRAHLPAFVDDYAFLVEGLLALHQATHERKWLNAARGLTEMQIAGFWDSTRGGFYFTPHDHEKLIARTKPVFDSVIPSANSVSVRNLIRLASLTDQPQYRDRARQILENYSAAMQKSPRGMTGMALAASEFLDNPDFRVAPLESSRLQELEDLGESEIQLISAEGDSQPASESKSGGRQAQKGKNDQKVVGRAYLSVDRLPAGKSCRLLVLLRIEDGWHINTNPAQPDYLTATELTVESVAGCKVADIQYPAGKELEVEGFDESFRIYEKQVAIYAKVNVPAEAAGKTETLSLQVFFQACNDARCLKPSRLQFQGQIPVARVGEPVNAINAKLFP